MDPTKLLSDLPCRFCGLSFNPGEQKIVFEGRNFHQSCFNCKLCGKYPESSNDEMRAAKDLPYCRGTCWSSAVTQHCGGCGAALQPGQALVQVSGFHSKFHKECFCCSTCRKQLVAKFHKKDQNAYCTDCFKVVVKEALNKTSKS